jgi:hypothetical protein
MQALAAKSTTAIGCLVALLTANLLNLTRGRHKADGEALRAVLDASDVRRAEVNRKQQRILLCA